MKVDGYKSGILSTLFLGEYLDFKPDAIHSTSLHPINIRLATGLLTNLMARLG